MNKDKKTKRNCKKLDVDKLNLVAILRGCGCPIKEKPKRIFRKEFVYISR